MADARENKKTQSQQYLTVHKEKAMVKFLEGTADTLVVIKNLGDQLAQWSNGLGLQFSHNVINSPQSGYTKIVYGDGSQLVGYSAQGQGHFVPFHEVRTLQFFGLLPLGDNTTSTTSATSVPSHLLRVRMELPLFTGNEAARIGMGQQPVLKELASIRTPIIANAYESATTKRID